MSAAAAAAAAEKQFNLLMNENRGTYVHIIKRTCSSFFWQQQ